MESVEFFAQNYKYFVLIHVASVIVGMGAAIISDILFSIFSRDKILSPGELRSLTRLSNIIWASLFFIIISGICIFLSNPLAYLASAKFLSKMSIVLIIILNGYALLKLVQPHLINPNFFTSTADRKTRKIAFACGAISLISWLSAFALAIPDSLTFSFIEIMSLYIIVLIISVFVALQVENRYAR